jgi:hypothetical protein
MVSTLLFTEDYGAAVPLGESPEGMTPSKQSASELSDHY